MAQNNSGTNSGASQNKTYSKKQNTNRKPVAEIKKQLEKEQEKSRKANYDLAKDGMVQLRNILNNVTARSITSATRDTIKGYLSNIGGSSANLITASRYLYYRSPIYASMIQTFVNMYCLDCRKLTPKADLSKGLDTNKTIKQYNATADMLDVMALKNTMVGPLYNAWLEDVSFNLWLHDDTGSFFYRIDPSEAVIDSIYTVDGGFTFGFAMDMSRWRNQSRQDIIEAIGEPLTTAWNEYQRTGAKYIHIDPEYSMVLKVRTDLWDTNIPPLIAKFLQYANLADLEENQSAADDLSFYKLIYMPMETVSSQKSSDEWKVSPDLSLEYFDVLQRDAIPGGVSSAVIPGELKTIDFSDNVSEDVSRVEKAQTQILGTSGGVGAMTDAQKAINNTAVFNAAIRNDSAFALNSLLPQIEAWTNMQLGFNVSNPCKVTYSPISIHTKEDYRKAILESCQYSFAMRLEYGTLLGYSEKATLLQMQLENEIFDLPNKMIYPLQSSYTTSNNGDGEVGRPETPDDELSPQGQRSRANS